MRAAVKIALAKGRNQRPSKFDSNRVVVGQSREIGGQETCCVIVEPLGRKGNKIRAAEAG
jgi:hypothetical protein